MWRLTPRLGEGAASLLPRVQGGGADTPPPTSQAAPDMFAPAQVVPRLPAPGGPLSGQGEVWLRPAYEALNQALIKRWAQMDAPGVTRHTDTHLCAQSSSARA